jgi:hypothetical protein
LIKQLESFFILAVAHKDFGSQNSEMPAPFLIRGGIIQVD